jgi:SAM-dependent methyltransferase
VRFGRLYRDRLLRQFAEHLLVPGGLTLGRTVVDVLCDGGAATALATQSVGMDGSVTAVDYLEDCLPAAAAMSHGARLTVRKCSRNGLPFSDATFDAAVSLLTAGWAEPEMFDEMLRITKPGSPVALLSYSGADAVHEKILLDAVTGTDGANPSYAEPLLRQLPANGLLVTKVRDVVRFDGAHQFWDVMTDGRDIFDGGAQAQDASSHVRDLVANKLEPYTAPDGTIRIPVDLTLLTANN